MVFRNREGAPVDAVPFVVTAGSAFLLLYSFVPLYLHALGIQLAGALAITSLLFGLATMVAYTRQIHRVNPERRRLVPAEVRFRRLVYLMLLAVGVVVLLALPLVFR